MPAGTCHCRRIGLDAMSAELRDGLGPGRLSCTMLGASCVAVLCALAECATNRALPGRSIQALHYNPRTDNRKGSL